MTKTVTFRISENYIIDRQTLAEKFNKFYVNIENKLAIKIPIGRRDTITNINSSPPSVAYMHQ